MRCEGSGAAPVWEVLPRENCSRAVCPHCAYYMQTIKPHLSTTFPEHEFVPEAERWGGVAQTCIGSGEAPMPWDDDHDVCGGPGCYFLQDRGTIRMVQHKVTPRDFEESEVSSSPTCQERWPECQAGEYDPRCCRFPKSCSARPADEPIATSVFTDDKRPLLTEKQCDIPHTHPPHLTSATEICNGRRPGEGYAGPTSPITYGVPLPDLPGGVKPAVTATVMDGQGRPWIFTESENWRPAELPHLSLDDPPAYPPLKIRVEPRFAKGEVRERTMLALEEANRLKKIELKILARQNRRSWDGKSYEDLFEEIG